MSDKILDEKLICDVMLPPATIIKCGCDLRTLLAAINQRSKFPPTQRVLRDAALAQQPAQAAPEGWKLVPLRATREQVNAVCMHPDLARTLYRNMVEAAPAAPEPAAQEPVAWIYYNRADLDDVRATVQRWDDMDGEWIESPLYTAPPAAEQPYSTTSDKYRAELYDEVWEKARSMGYGNVTMALAELERHQAAEQPDTVKVRELLELVMCCDITGGGVLAAQRAARALLGKEGKA